METPKTKDVKTPIKPDKIDQFTTQLVAMNAFFMNEVFELIHEIARLKEASLNVGKRSKIKDQNKSGKPNLVVRK